MRIANTVIYYAAEAKRFTIFSKRMHDVSMGMQKVVDRLEEVAPEHKQHSTNERRINETYK